MDSSHQQVPPPPTSGGPRPTLGGRGRGARRPVGGRIVKEGDWECKSCANINFAKRTKCNACQEPRSKESEESAAELAAKRDWACTHCGNINWARRDKCNMCNASKPHTGEEPRLGRGGGHFDLQDPSDRNRHDSDTEDFDEFGRKKKKRSSRDSWTESKGRALPSAIVGSSNVLRHVKVSLPPAPLDAYTSDEDDIGERRGTTEISGVESRRRVQSPITRSRSRSPPN